MPLKQYLTHSVIKDGKPIQTNLGEFETSSPTFRMDVWSVLTKAADKQWGNDKWKFREDKSLGGAYAVALHEPHKGETIHVDPFPVE